MRYLYNFFLYLILPFLPLRLLWRSRKNNAYRHRVLERFAYYNFPTIKNSIWVHAVSLGESIAAIPLVEGLINRYPNLPIVFTSMTPTAAERVRKIFGQKVLQLYLPYDYPLMVKRFLRQTNPKILVLVETELWPNILHYSAKNKIPIMLVNARMSARSFCGYKKIRGLMQEAVNCITMVMAQSKIDADRFLALGMKPEKISVVGNIKFDLEVSSDVLLQAQQLRTVLGQERPIWVAASTHAGEEEKVLVAAKMVLKALPEALLILVPRHPERFDEVFNLCRQEGFNVTRYSEIKHYEANTNIILGDVMGKMLLFYGSSDIAFVGGSLIPWGGHNLLEPAALSKPVLSGVNLSAFLEISQMLDEADALVKVEDELMLAKKLIELFQNKSLREKLGTAANNVVEKRRGVTKKILATIENTIEQSSHYD